MRSSFFITADISLQVLIVLSCILQPVNGYASWFVERSSSCWVALRDPSEVIMNNKIVPYEQSSTPNVKVELYEKDSGTLMDLQNVDGKNTIYIDDFTKQSDFGQDEKWSQTYIVKLNYDAHREELHDLQYVMDIKVFPELDDDQLDKLDGSETRIQAEFTSGITGCHNYRASGRGNDDGLELKITIPSSVFQLNEANIADHKADVVAGYACGHEAVVLTQSIIFKPRLAHRTTIVDNVGKEERTLGEDTPNDIEISPTKEDEEKLSHSRHEEPNIDDGDLMEEEENLNAPNLSQNDANARKEESLRKHANYHRIHHRATNERSEVRKFKDQYHKDEFGQANFTANSYLTAVVVFIIVSGTVINALVAIGNPRGRKREHTL